MDFDVEKTLLAHSTSGCVIDETAARCWRRALGRRADFA